MEAGYCYELYGIAVLLTALAWYRHRENIKRLVKGTENKFGSKRKGHRFMANVGVIGAGSWGTALSVLLADNGHHVTIWSIDEKEVEMLCMHKENRQICTLSRSQE